MRDKTHVTAGDSRHFSTGVHGVGPNASYWPFIATVHSLDSSPPGMHPQRRTKRPDADKRSEANGIRTAVRMRRELRDSTRDSSRDIAIPAPFLREARLRF